MRTLCFFIAAAFLVFCWGCGSAGDSRRQAEESCLKPIAIFYSRFIPQHQGKPPKDEAEFKAFLKEPMNAEELQKSFNVADIDAMFISTRDKKPFMIIYGPSSGAGPAGQPVIAYEQEGVNGKRFVASKLGAVEEVDESKFAQYVTGS